MAVHPDISRHQICAEMPRVEALAATYGWEVDHDYDRLVVVVRMQSHTGDRFIVEARCDNYKEMPPLLDFIDPWSGDKGTARAYPKGNDTFFHESGPCICAPFSRKAYSLHGEWNQSDWMNSTAQGVQWSNHSTLAGIFGMIQARLSRPELYGGRMAG